MGGGSSKKNKKDKENRQNPSDIPKEENKIVESNNNIPLAQVGENHNQQFPIEILKKYHPNLNNLQIKGISQELMRRNISMIELIGEGPLAINFLASNFNKVQVVLKAFKVENECDISACLNEVKHMKSINSQYVAKVFDSFCIKESGLFFMVQELCSGGILYQLIQQNQLQQNDIIRISCQILQGIIDINRQNIIHSNIDPMCILFSKEREVKITGFRYSKQVEKSTYSVPQNHHSVNYSPIEQLSGTVNLQSDRFSVGVVITEMCGVIINPIDQIECHFGTVNNTNKKNSLIIEIVEKLLRPDPIKREDPQRIIELLNSSMIPRNLSNVDNNRVKNTIQIIQEYLGVKELNNSEIQEIAIFISSKVEVIKKLVGDIFSPRLIIESLNNNKEKVILRVEAVEQSDLNSYKQQIMFWKKLNSDNIVQLFEHSQKGKVFISIIEYCDENMGQRMKKIPNLTKIQILNYLQQIANGLQDLHSQNIIHRNLQMETIFINSKNQIKISDFSCAVQYNPLKDSQNNDQNGSIYKKQVNKYNDIYYLGLIFLKIVEPSQHFENIQISQVEELKTQNKETELINLICKMMTPNIEDRIKLKGVIELIENLQNGIQNNLDKQIKDFLSTTEMGSKGIDQTLQILKQQSSPQNILGKGAFGIVVECQNKQGKKVAIKIVNSKKNSEMIEQCEQEAQNMKKIKSNNVVQLFSYQNNIDCGSFFFELEKCSPQTLQSRINIGSLTEQQIKKFMKDTIQGLIDIHDQNIVHSDLKLDNLLLTENDKICDFGLSVQLPDSKSVIQSKGQNFQNSSPEQLSGNVQKESDIFALGMILIQMIFPTMEHINLIQLKFKKTNFPTRGKFPLLVNLANKLIELIPEERISLKDAQQLLNI